MMRRFCLLLACACLAYGATGLYFVQPDEQAVVRRCGRALPTPREPGPHFGLPWGWDRIDRYKPREVKFVMLGPVSLGGAAVGANPAQFLTGDRNLINVRATVQYSIQDPLRYLYQAARTDLVVARLGEAALTEALSREPVDRALTLGKDDLGVLVRGRLQHRVDSTGLGITVRSVDIGSVQPPAEVAEAFDGVVSALRERDQQIYQSQSYANRTLAESQAAAQRVRDVAHGQRDRTLRQAEGEVSRFEKLLAEYERAPALTARRLYLELLSETLAQFRAKLIVDDGSDLDLSIWDGAKK
jgi:membrane protease subunit HflK